MPKVGGGGFSGSGFNNSGASIWGSLRKAITNGTTRSIQSVMPGKNTATASTNPNKKYLLNTLIIDENYLYISYLDEDLKYWRLPCVADEITDTMGSTFSENSALGRSAPVMTYSKSGPRTVHITLPLHRDIMEDVNHAFSNSKLGYGEDYVDNLIHALQAIAVPKYNKSNKAIEPPLVALRLTNEIFIKGVVNNAISVTYAKPILANGKYAQVTVAFDITEVDPYDAETIYQNGSFRGIVATIKDGMYLK